MRLANIFPIPAREKKNFTREKNYVKTVAELGGKDYKQERIGHLGR